jgi:hypothetical protein
VPSSSKPGLWIAAVAALGVLALPAPAASRDLGAAPPCELPGAEGGGRRYLVAAIGDSLTDLRVGGGRYVRYLGRRCPGSRFDAYGVGGQQTSHMRWRFLHDVFGVGQREGPRKPRYSHVIVLGGVNDLTAGTLGSARIERIRDNLSFMYAEARRRGVQVVALTVPPWGRLRGVRDRRRQATESLNAWIAGQAGAGHVDHVVALRPLLECGATGVLCPRYRLLPQDDVHWGLAGHEVVARELHARVFADCR